MNSIKRLFLLVAFLPLLTLGQDKDRPKANWQNLDLQQDGVFGISTEKAYKELLKEKKGRTVVVAVIDGGVDVRHEDLQGVMWSNPNEIQSNGIDEDKNGYADDVHGWNFLGSAKGSVHYDNLEVVRLIKTYQDKYASVVNSTPLTAQERKEFNLYKKLVTDYMEKLANAKMGYDNVSILHRTVDSIVSHIGKKEPSLHDFEHYNPRNEYESKSLKIVKSELKKEGDYKKFKEELDESYQYYMVQVKYNLNMDFNSRDTVGDDYTNRYQHYYGNADVTGPDPMHGTHVAGIIAADRTNRIGVQGVATNVRIMSVRAVPDGDERDKDVANAIRYAVDNGAKVINMSFGKSYSWDKKLVDSAVKYAASKDVLIVHAAGNDGKNTDFENNFPTRIFEDSTNANYWGMNRRLSVVPGRPGSSPGYGYGAYGMPSGPRSNAALKAEPDTAKLKLPQAQNWIEVGASSWKDDIDLVASFSNYGKRTVDVFAPGVKIYSTVPGSKYKENDGTSMACPVVAGVAALIRSYYPGLTALQVKDVIMRSVTRVDHKVKVKENGESKRVNFTDVCISGGIVNAYHALKLADEVSNRSVSSR